MEYQKTLFIEIQNFWMPDQWYPFKLHWLMCTSLTGPMQNADCPAPFESNTNVQNNWIFTYHNLHICNTDTENVHSYHGNLMLHDINFTDHLVRGLGVKAQDFGPRHPSSSPADGFFLIFRFLAFWMENRAHRAPIIVSSHFNQLSLEYQ